MSSLYMNRVKPNENAEIEKNKNHKSSLENEDEILDWVSNLNFEEYQNTWTNLITLPK